MLETFVDKGKSQEVDFYEQFKKLRKKGFSIWKIFNHFNKKENNKQRFRISSGKLWERIVKDYLNEELEFTPLIVVEGKELKENHNKIYEFLAQRPKKKCTQEECKIFPDTDLVVIDRKNKAGIAILSCKTSLRERGVLQTIAWKFMMPQIPVFLVTVDRGSGKDGLSELGTCKKPKKNRMLAESFLDKIYVPSGRKGMDFCAVVRKFENLSDDLMEMQKSREKGHKKLAFS